MIGPIIVGAFALTCIFVAWDSHRFSRNLDLKIARIEGIMAGARAYQKAEITELPDGRQIIMIDIGNKELFPELFDE